MTAPDPQEARTLVRQGYDLCAGDYEAARCGDRAPELDLLLPHLGAEVPIKWVQPYLEYTVDIPVNRQGYECHTGRVSRGDVCLGLDDFSASDPVNQGGPGYAAVPSRLSLGARVRPFSSLLLPISSPAWRIET